MKHKMRFISLVLVLVMVSANITFAAELETSIVITNTVEPTDINREFQVTYNMSVDATSSIETPAVVLAIDRSGSMLWTDSNGNRVVDTVRAAVEQFITSYYLHNPGGDLAIVSFGTGAVAHDNYKYHNNPGEALDAVDFIYGYYWDTKYYRYQWDNWSDNQGYTNIGEAFEQSAKTVELDKKSDTSSDDVIILFSDGVPTTFKSSNDPNSKTGSYPTTHNESTIYAYTEGQNAQDWADVITVGYYGAYQYYPQTRAIAQETMELAQNAGFYTTNELSEIDDMFETILTNIEYLGTEARVKEIVNSEFVVDPDSVKPSGASVTVDPITGQTTILWDLGNLYLSDYEFGYTVKAKDDIYPSGKDDVIVNNISIGGAGLTYIDLDGDEQFEQIPEIVIDILAHEIIPAVELDVYHEYSSSKSYLIGDTALIHHDLLFSNQLLSSDIGNIMFDFVKINVKDYSKELINQDGDIPLDNFDDIFELLSEDWDLNNSAIGYSIDETVEADTPETLVWEKNVNVEMLCLQEGDYDFLHSITYELYNEYSDIPFIIELNNLVEDEIKVRNGTVEFNLDNEFDEAITYGNIIIMDHDTGEIVMESDDSENVGMHEDRLYFDHIPSGVYDVILETPSGYKVADGQDLVINEDDHIIFENQTLNYDNPLLHYNIDFISLDVGEISITTAEGDSVIYRNNTSDDVDLIMTFAPMSEAEELHLPIVDTFNYDGDITIDASSLVVRNSSGVEVQGFTMVGNKLLFNSASPGAPDYLSVDTYTAEFTITSLPSNLSGQVMPVNDGGETIYRPVPGHTFELTVSETYTKAIGSNVLKQNEASAKELKVVYDEIGPEILMSPSETEYTDDNITIDIMITSEYTELVDYMIIRVEQDAATLGDFSGLITGYGFKTLQDNDLYNVYGDIQVTIREEDWENPLDGIYKGNGYFAVLAIDQAGNIEIKIINISNLIFIDEFEVLM